MYENEHCESFSKSVFITHSKDVKWTMRRRNLCPTNASSSSSSGWGSVNILRFEDKQHGLHFEHFTKEHTNEQSVCKCRCQSFQFDCEWRNANEYAQNFYLILTIFFLGNNAT